MGVTLIIIGGGLDLSVGANMAMANVVVSLLLLKAVPWWLAILAAICVSTFFGIVNGLFITKFNLHSIIVTIGMAGVIRGLAYILLNGQTVVVTSQEVKYFGVGRLFGFFPTPVLLLIIVTIVMYLVSRHTTFGRSVYAIGGNKRASYLSGIDVHKVQIISFIITGFLSGVAGIVLTGMTGVGTGNSANGWELDIIAAILIGGISIAGGEGNLIGTILGLMFIGVVNNTMALLGMDSYVQMVAKGAVLLLAIVLSSLQGKALAKNRG